MTKKMISILFLLIIIILPTNVFALRINENDLSIQKGNKKNIELYTEIDTEVTQINFTLIYTSYDVPGYFNVSSDLTDNLNGIKHQITFPEPVSGKINLGTINIDVVKNPKVRAGTINIHSASALTINNEKINLKSQTINVNITEEPQEEPIVSNNTADNDTSVETEKNTQETNLLEKIESEIVNIGLKQDVYEYKVYIEDELESLDLKPIVKDDKYQLEISSQKIAELKDNQIIITVKDGEYTEEYKIIVKKLSEQEKIEIDESEFTPTYSYKTKWIVMIVLLSIGLIVGLYFIKKNK